MRLNSWFITNPDYTQQEILKENINNSIVVKGAAGSGKTNLAIYRANQTRGKSFIIIVYTVALKKMVKYGLNELGLDKDRVVYEWSWKNRGIEISGDVFCLKDNKKYGLNKNLIILKTKDDIKFFISDNKYDKVISRKYYKKYLVSEISNPLKVSIDFDDWVDTKYYKTFYRRTRWFIQIQIKEFNFNLNDRNDIEFIASGFLFKKKGRVKYLIIDEGQDFSILDYRNSFIPKAQKSISIFGDSSQRIYKERGTRIDKIANALNYPIKELIFNYRIPKTIAKVAQRIPKPKVDLITKSKKNNGNSDYPSFPKPIIKKCKSEYEEIQFIIRRIKTEGLDDVAILLPNNDKIEKVHKYFKKEDIGTQVKYNVDIPENIRSGKYPRFRKVDTLDFTNNDLPCILTFHSAKGTEFDNIFIPFADEDNNIKKNPLYVAMTRASNSLFITYSRKLTEQLTKVSKDDVMFI